MQKIQRIWRNLTLRIAVPLTAVVLVFGFLLCFLVFNTISEFVHNEINSDLEGLSHRLYNICDIKFNEILYSGLADNEDSLFITQALTLGAFEDFFRQENLEGLVYQQKSRELLLETMLPMSAGKIMAKEKQQGKIYSLETETEEYFAYHFDFSPWDWQIIILKNKREYSDLITQVQKVHFITLGLLIISAFLFVFFLHQSIKLPIDAIINPIKKGLKPKYKGINVFEFLSDTIAVMMDSLQESEKKYRSLVEATRDFVWEVDKDSVFTYASPSIQDLLGFAPEEVIGKTFFDFMIPVEGECLKKLIDGIQISKSPVHGLENRGLKKNGQDFVVFETSGVPIIDADGNLSGYRGISRDITERKREEKNKLQFELRIQQVEKAESLSCMAGAIAHHFNNILATTIGNLELISDELTPGTQISENFAEAQKSVWRAVEMSNLMLTFLGQSQGNPKVHDLSENCRRHLMSLQKNITDSIRVEIDLPVPGPIIKADPAQIRNVLGVLFRNAEEAMKDSSDNSIQISAGTVQAEEISVGKCVPAGWTPSVSSYACLTVTDTGCGIKEDIIGRIFDPFYTDKFIGRGIGLSIALGIIKAHNGSILVESGYGRGSTFKIFLPLSKESIPQTKKPAVKISPVVEKGLTVLLVEDQDVLLNMARAMLERFGFKVLTASDGVEAVEIFRNNRKDIGLVISDLSMPRMNGWETLKALRAIHSDIPVILASGYDEAVIMNLDHTEKPQAFLHKPYQMKTMKEIIDHVLGREAI